MDVLLVLALTVAGLEDAVKALVGARAATVRPVIAPGASALG